MDIEKLFSSLQESYFYLAIALYHKKFFYNHCLKGKERKSSIDQILQRQRTDAGS